VDHQVEKNFQLYILIIKTQRRILWKGKMMNLPFKGENRDEKEKERKKDGRKDGWMDGQTDE
jgi:hypothetical protein